MSGDEKLCKTFFEKLFFQNVLGFVYIFCRYHYPFISSTQIVCYVVCVQQIIQ